MKKINYILDENNIITYWVRIPFDASKPYIAIDDNVEIHSGFDKIIDGEFIQDLAGYEASLEQAKLKDTKIARIQELKDLLAESDYLCLKHADGDLTDEEYETVKAQRHAWRAEINELEA